MTYEGTEFFDLTIRSQLCLDETRDQDTAFETETKTEAVTLKTKTVKILSRDETVSRDFTIHITVKMPCIAIPYKDIMQLRLRLEHE